MATNDFLPFATGAGANVLSQAAWAELAQRPSGFQSGVAQSAQLNKAWRQSSIMAAVLAQFIVDMSGKDALDDGTTTNLLAALKASVSASSPAIVGSVRNARMSVASASATATFAADEIIVESALGGLTYRVSSFSKTINLATTGAGGMDSGAAPANGYVAIYAIYNPLTGASALLATNAASAVPEVYSGGGMPSGYTASALVSVWRTNASRQLLPGAQRARRVSYPMYLAVQNSSTPPSTPTALSIAVPPNAVSIWGELLGGANTSAIVTVVVGATAAMTGQQAVVGEVTGPGGGTTSNYRLDLVTPAQMYWQATVSAGTPNISIGISGYEF